MNGKDMKTKAINLYNQMGFLLLCIMPSMMIYASWTILDTKKYIEAMALILMMIIMVPLQIFLVVCLYMYIKDLIDGDSHGSQG